MAKKKSSGFSQSLAALPKAVQARYEITDPQVLNNLRREEDTIKICMLQLRKRLEEEKRRAIEDRSQAVKKQEKLVAETEEKIVDRTRTIFSDVVEVIESLFRVLEIEGSDPVCKISTELRRWLNQKDANAAIPVQIYCALGAPHSSPVLRLQYSPLGEDQEAMAEYYRLRDEEKAAGDRAVSAQAALADIHRYREELECVPALRRLQEDKEGSQMLQGLQEFVDTLVDQVLSR